MKGRFMRLFEASRRRALRIARKADSAVVAQVREAIDRQLGISGQFE